MNSQDILNLQEAYLSVYENSYILNYLLEEGYAETPESAYIIMENMSEDWKKEVKGALIKTGKYVGRKIAKSTPAKKLKRFAKYTTLGVVGGALLN